MKGSWFPVKVPAIEKRRTSDLRDCSYIIRHQYLIFLLTMFLYQSRLFVVSCSIIKLWNLTVVMSTRNLFQLASSLFSQTDRHSPLLGLRSRPSLDGGKMRASVRMTRYLESWGAAKPFANLHHRDSVTTDNGKINTTVSRTRSSLSVTNTQSHIHTKMTHSVAWFLFKDVPMGLYHFQRRERWAQSDAASESSAP